MDGQVKEYYIRVMKVPSACESGLVFCSKIKFIDYATLVYSKKSIRACIEIISADNLFLDKDLKIQLVKSKFY